jgi:hypothetical protein
MEWRFFEIKNEIGKVSGIGTKNWVNPKSQFDLDFSTLKAVIS